MNSAESFSADYGEARAKFTHAAAAAGGALEQIEHPTQGPAGEPLYTDVARFGPDRAEKMLVLISGTHGVEGFCGSGAQVDFLRRGEAANLPDGVGLLMIHAINPYGFAWLRRVTHENIDLNRNWINFSKPLPANPGYDELSAVLCPDTWTDDTAANIQTALDDYLARKGATALKNARMAGQYHHPSGIFFGGQSPSWSRTTQTQILQNYLADASKVAIIDYHTGLGPWGLGEQIITASRDAPAFQRAAQWYGAALTSIADGSSLAAHVGGDGLSAAVRLLPHCEVTTMALEIGTKPQSEVRIALCAEAWLHAYGDMGSEKGAAIKRGLRDAFYGDADDWKGMVAGQSLLACRQALSGLSNGRTHREP